MKAILLAAGRGTRISRQIEGKPKCTVRLDGTTLIEYTVDLLASKGVDDVVLALGYRDDVIRQTLSGRGVSYRVNPFYDVTNSIASLWFARDALEASDRVIVMNADVFLSEAAIDLILSEGRSPVLFYDTTRREEADYKFKCEGERLVKYGKGLSLEETSGEYVGCAVLSGPFVKEFTLRLDALVREQRHSLWWEDVLYSMADERPILVRDIAGAFWGEVDYIEDYERIMKFYEETERRAGEPGLGSEPRP